MAYFLLVTYVHIYTYVPLGTEIRFSFHVCPDNINIGGRTKRHIPFGDTFSIKLLCKCLVWYNRPPTVFPHRLIRFRYLDFLENELSTLLNEVHLDKSMDMFFQHDRASAYSTYQVTHHLNLSFPEKWIGRNSHVY